MRSRINVRDTALLRIAKWMNRAALVTSWSTIVIAVLVYLKTNSVWQTLFWLMFTPVRYFFFDTAPQKEQQRPLSLDRSIPLTVFVRYLSRRFPIPQGNLMADIWGFFLAVGRAFINGYGLLYFDTFTFAFAIRRTSDGVPLQEDIKVLHSSERLAELQKQADAAMDDTHGEELQRLYKEWVKTRDASQLNEWNFPLRRYIQPGDDRAKLNEVGASAIDDKYQLNLLAYDKYKKSKQRK